MDKVCKNCNQTKLLSEFNKRSDKKDGLDNFCRLCSRERTQNYYHNNREVQVKKASGRVLKRKRKIIKYVRENIKKKCSLCPEDFPSCLDFHHLRDKKFTISAELTDHSWKKILEEIDKCILLCANCHRKYHFKNFSLLTDKPNSRVVDIGIDTGL